MLKNFISPTREKGKIFGGYSTAGMKTCEESEEQKIFLRYYFSPHHFREISHIKNIIWTFHINLNEAIAGKGAKIFGTLFMFKAE